MRPIIAFLGSLGACSLAACSGTEDAGSADHDTSAQAAFVWPAALAPFGGGYPEEGSACSRLGESAAVSDYLDHTAILVGCPGGATGDAALALMREEGARLVAEVEGVALLSISTE